MRSRAGLFALLIGSSFAMCVGCSSERRAPVSAVSGKLMIAGKPAEGATIFFHPKGAEKSNTPHPMAVVQADGTFTPTTYLSNDGAPPGEYLVTVRWTVKSTVEGEVIEGPDLLKERFSNRANPAATVIIKEEETVIPPIELN